MKSVSLTKMIDDGWDSTSDEMKHVLFMQAFTRLAERDASQMSAYYDPFLHYIFLPADPDPARAALAMHHEAVHASLGHTLFSLTIETLDIITSRLNHIVGGLMYPGIKDTLSEEPLSHHYRNLDEREEARKDLRGHRKRFDDVFTQLFTNEPVFEAAARLLLDVDLKKRALLGFAQMWHEGYATFVEIVTDHSEYDWYLLRVKSLFPGLNDSAHRKIRVEIHDLVQSKKRSLEAKTGTRGTYIHGYRFYVKIANACGHEDAAKWAALLVGHFPFYAVDLLNLSLDEFRIVLTSNFLGLDNRLAYLASNPSIVEKFMKSRDAQGALIRLLDGHDPPPISDGAASFRLWENRHLLGEMGRRLGSVIPQVYERLPSDSDDRFDVRDSSPEDTVPCLVTATGEVSHRDRVYRDMFMRRVIEQFCALTTVDRIYDVAARRGIDLGIRA